MRVCAYDKYGKKMWWGITHQWVKLHWLIRNFLSFSFKIFTHISTVLNDCMYILYFFLLIILTYFNNWNIDLTWHNLYPLVCEFLQPLSGSNGFWNKYQYQHQGISSLLQCSLLVKQHLLITKVFIYTVQGLWIMWLWKAEHQH
jgi:hypothetical protein